MKFSLRERMFRIWYWYVNKADRNAEVLFMNYGYNDGQLKIPVKSCDELHHYSMQLYHQLADSAPIKNKDILEIGCGRGGGLSYVSKTFAPSSALGIDLVRQSVTFCQRYYRQEGLVFQHGNAQKLHLPDQSFDAVLNVESSHRYTDVSAFIGEVYRVLRPGGYFLITDFRNPGNLAELRELIAGSNLMPVKETLITGQVLDALQLTDKRRRDLVVKLAPKFLHKTGFRFAAVAGTETYNKFKTGEFVYFSSIYRKPEVPV